MAVYRIKSYNRRRCWGEKKNNDVKLHLVSHLKGFDKGKTTRRTNGKAVAGLYLDGVLCCATGES